MKLGVRLRCGLMNSLGRYSEPEIAVRDMLQLVCFLGRAGRALAECSPG